jgi:cellulose synthase/poly-beta-1,6-N-acetylglucosamine synthase-like glycosyltransferase
MAFQFFYTLTTIYFHHLYYIIVIIPYLLGSVKLFLTVILICNYKQITTLSMLSCVCWSSVFIQTLCHFLVGLFIFLWWSYNIYWSLNSELLDCKASTLLLEPRRQPILFDYFGDSPG